MAKDNNLVWWGLGTAALVLVWLNKKSSCGCESDQDCGCGGHTAKLGEPYNPYTAVNLPARCRFLYQVYVTFPNQYDIMGNKVGEYRNLYDCDTLGYRAVNDRGEVYPYELPTVPMPILKF